MTPRPLRILLSIAVLARLVILPDAATYAAHPSANGPAAFASEALGLDAAAEAEHPLLSRAAKTRLIESAARLTRRGLLAMFFAAPAAAQQAAGPFRPANCSGAYCHSTLEALAQTLTQYPSYTLSHVDYLYGIDQSGWHLQSISVAIPGSQGPIYQVDMSGTKPVPPIMARPIFGGATQSLSEVVTVGTVRSLLPDKERIAAFPAQHAPSAFESDPAALPQATRDLPLGRLYWEYYANFYSLTIAMERQADGTVNRTFYFPLQDQLKAPHPAQSEQEVQVAAKYAELLKKGTTLGWPVYLFFDRIVNFRRDTGALATRFTSRDREGRLELGVAIVVDMLFMVRILEAPEAAIVADMEAVLAHEISHIPQVWGYASEVLQISDQIARFARGAPSRVWREKLEGAVGEARTAWYELQAMDHQTVKLPEGPGHIAITGSAYREKNESRIRAAVDSIFDMFISYIEPSGSKEWTAWVEGLLRKEMPPAPRAANPRASA